jgi:hypothetical protein
MGGLGGSETHSLEKIRFPWCGAARYAGSPINWPDFVKTDSLALISSQNSLAIEAPLAL